jgi:hypothetical protein
MKHVKLLITIILLNICLPTWGQSSIVLGQWNFNGVTGFGISPFAPATTAGNITIGGLTRGPGIATTMSGTPAANAWGGAGFPNNATVPTMAEAINTGSFVTFTITANSGYNVSFEEIAKFNTRRSNTGPQEMQWQYSLDGTNFTDIGFSQATGTTTSNGTEQDATPLTAEAALQNVPAGTTVTFRLVIWNALGNGGGAWYFNGSGSAASPSLIFKGVVSPGGPLPLQLLSFKGEPGKEANRLDWTTAAERNVARFELERSTNGQHFTAIAVLDAKGNDLAGNHQYTYLDNTAGATAFYRLKMIDRDGRFNYSAITVIRKDIIAGSSVHLYPNPAGKTLFIEGLQGEAVYFVTDILGRNVRANTATTAKGTVSAIDVADLPSGYYFLKFRDEYGSAAVKFIKE